MDFSGSQKILAPRVQVFEALLNPEVIQSCIPGCEAAEFVDFPTGRQLKLTISVNIPGLKVCIPSNPADARGLLNPGKVFPTLHRCAELGRMHVHAGKLAFPDIPRF